MAKGIGIICKSKPYLNQHTLKTLYYCFVFPYIKYCNMVIPIHLNCRNEQLEFRPMRIILHILVISFWVTRYWNGSNILQTAISMFKLHKAEVPACFKTMFLTNNKTHNYNTRFGSNLRTPKHNTNIVKQSLKFVSTHFWNTIPLEIRNSHSNCIFKAHMKNISSCSSMMHLA